MIRKRYGMYVGITIAVVFALCLFSGCGTLVPPENKTEQQPSVEVGIQEDDAKKDLEQESPTPDLENETQTEEKEQFDTQSTEHSNLYIADLPVEKVIEYFNEVCLDAEFSEGGNPSVLQKWISPIAYELSGPYTDTDLAVLESFVQWLNTVEGFPGIAESQNPLMTNLRIYFGTQDEMVQHLGANFAGMDGGVTFWYEDNRIYDAIICYCSEIYQIIRNSVILEEIYNGLGPVQDTWLREDSIIFAGYSEPQSLTAVDELIIRLLYHPQMKCGMNAAECEAVIRQLYY